MKDIRIEEIKFMPAISIIIKENFWLFTPDITDIKLSEDTEDTKESFDMVYKSNIEISIRIRNQKYLRYADFTIRCGSYYGGETEIDKLRNGKGSVYLYAWKTVDNNSFESWVLVDINKIRDLFNKQDKKIIYNIDGTAFHAYNLQQINSMGGLINYYNLNINNAKTLP